MNVLAYVHLRNIHGSTGAGRVARQMVEHLASGPAGLNLEILADAGDHRRVVPLVGAPWTDFRYRFLPRETSRQQALWLLWHRPVAEAFWPEAQIVYCAGESYVPTRRTRLAVTMHDAAFFERDAHDGRSFAYWKQRLKWSYLYRVLARKADALVAVSEFSAGRLAHFFPAFKGRLRVVPNAVPDRFFASVSAGGTAALRALGLHERAFVLLPGGLHYRKNAELVLAAWPTLRSAHPEALLVVSGHCDPAYAARARVLDESVRLLGFVDDELLCALYHAALAVWVPSRYEGFGLPVVEAMACGAPVVASNSSSLTEVGGDAAVFVPTDAAARHVEALDGLLRDESARGQLAERGRTRAAGYTWDRSAAKLREEFAALL